jgi:hypothetical protein
MEKIQRAALLTTLIDIAAFCERCAGMKSANTLALVWEAVSNKIVAIQGVRPAKHL